MASRQLGKSTIAACMIAWAIVFYPNNKAVILNMKQNAARNNLATIKFIINNLPSWMVTRSPFKSKSDIKTYFELFNGSRVDTFYPSTIHSSSTLARSLTVPILYIDESAFIRDMSEIYGSAQQTLSKARQQAIKNRYPYFILTTSTPLFC
jgi:phage terminase large subunit GpA-like protein